MTHRVILVLAAVALAAGPSAAARRPRHKASEPPRTGRPEVRETYRVNAQFRGAVKKVYTDLGTVSIVEHETGPGSFSVELEGKVRDPEDSSKVYTFAAAVSGKLDGSSVASSAQSSFSDDAEEYRDRIIEMAPFLRIVERAPLPQPGSPAEVAYHVNGKPYSLRYATTDKNVEATLYEGLRTVGKFFLVPGPSTGPHVFEKFRVNTVKKTVLSFVRLEPSKFRFRAPRITGPPPHRASSPKQQ